MTRKELRVRITHTRDLLRIAGGIEIDGHRVALALLLEAIRQGRRYVVIGPHMFVALAADLRERLTGSRDMRSASRHLSLRQGLRQRLQEPAQRRPQRA